MQMQKISTLVSVAALAALTFLRSVVSMLVTRPYCDVCLSMLVDTPGM